jgi:hypothetical protein
MWITHTHEGNGCGARCAAVGSCSLATYSEGSRSLACMWLCMMGRASSYHCASYSVVTAESCSSLIVDGVCHTAHDTPDRIRSAQIHRVGARALRTEAETPSPRTIICTFRHYKMNSETLYCWPCPSASFVASVVTEMSAQKADLVSSWLLRCAAHLLEFQLSSSSDQIKPYVMDRADE